MASGGHASVMTPLDGRGEVFHSPVPGGSHKGIKRATGLRRGFGWQSYGCHPPVRPVGRRRGRRSCRNPLAHIERALALGLTKRGPAWAHYVPVIRHSPLNVTSYRMGGLGRQGAEVRAKGYRAKCPSGKLTNPLNLL
jgi:hypothetical protein